MSRDILFCFSRTARPWVYFAQNLHSWSRHELYINAPYLEEFLYARFYRRFAPLHGLKMSDYLKHAVKYLKITKEEV